MPDRYTIICTCGYRTLVSGADFGSTVECFNCGADLQVDESTARHDEPTVARGPLENESFSPDAAELPVQGLPESPLVVHSPFEAEPGERPSSPFADEEEEGPEADVTAIEPGAAPPRARSPFEDDEPAAEEEPRTGPFTLEPPDTSFAELIETERPKFSGHVIVDNISALDKATGEKCYECDREIRGDWDRFETPNGVICYVCSNQATQGLPDRYATDKPERRELGEEDFLIDRSQPQTVRAEPPWYFSPESPEFKRALLILAFATIFLAVIVNITDWGTPSEETLRAARQAQEAEPEIVLPLWATVIVWSWRFAAACLGFMVAFYLVLDRDDMLPRDTFRGNVGYLATVLMVLAGIQLVTFVTVRAVGSIFVAGVIWNWLVSIVSFFAQILVIDRMLDLRIRDWLWAMFVYFPLTQIILQGIGLFIYAGVYRLAT